MSRYGAPVTCSGYTSAAPGTFRSTSATARARSSSATRLSPKILTPTSERIPVVTILLRSGDLHRLGERERGIRDGHEHQVTLVERRHELPADAGDEGQRARQDQQGGSESEDSVT